MLQTTGIYSSFAVKDLAPARAFYADTLGLALDVDEDMGMIDLQLPGGGRVLIYGKPDHEPAVFTVLNLQVDDVERAVADLKAAGVPFESYDGEYGTDENNISDGSFYGGPKIAWFRDPSGNILAVLDAG